MTTETKIDIDAMIQLLANGPGEEAHNIASALEHMGPELTANECTYGHPESTPLGRAYWCLDSAMTRWHENEYEACLYRVAHAIEHLIGAKQ